MTELGPGRTFCTQWAQRPPEASSGTSLPGSGAGTGDGPCSIGLGQNQLWTFGVAGA